MRFADCPSWCQIAFRLLVIGALLPAALGQSSSSTMRGPADRITPRVDGSIAPYKAWLEQDVVWIIADGERFAFPRLKNDDERNQFIDAFWSRRDPTPDTYDNEYKDEHYRRIAYANDHFSADAPGWSSDRGRIYIRYGPPDKIESYPAGKPQMDGQPKVGDAYLHRAEIWRYRYIEGVGQNVAVEFVDLCTCGHYEMQVAPTLEKALLYGPELIASEPNGSGGIQQYIVLLQPPRIRFKDLEEKLNMGIQGKGLPFDLRTDLVKATDFTSLVSVSINLQSHDLTFVEQDGSTIAKLDIMGRVITMEGRVVDVFENTLTIADLKKSGSGAASANLIKTLALRKGHYRLGVVARDVNSGRWETRSEVIDINE